MPVAPKYGIKNCCYHYRTYSTERLHTMKTALRAIIIVSVFLSAQCARILGVFPMPSSSHYILGSALMRGLAEKGHDVTVISAFGEKTPPKNGTYRDIVVKGAREIRQAPPQPGQGTMFDRDSTNPFLMSVLVTQMISKFTSKTLKDENVQKLINSNEQFDVVIVAEFLNDHHKALATHFKAPLVIFSPVGANFWVDSIVGNPSPPSYVPDVMLDYSLPMSFCERLVNFVKTVFNYILYHLFVYPGQNDLIKETIPGNIDIYDVLYNVSLVLVNSHPTTNQPVPYVPNMIDIGGFHIKPPKKLPDDLQKFLDEATEGVIYFSMGSNLKSADLPAEKRDAILRSFSKLKQKVLWKWEEDVLPGQPQNVKLGKWLPQQDILAHPNVKLFITHGGLLSTTEAIYHGVPVLAIPIFGDQKMNANRAVARGYGLLLLYKDISQENLSSKINDILNNPTFKENAKQRSKIFHDRIVSPMDTAVYWVEYVIRHKGAPHLRVAALDLPWYKYLLLDVIGFLVLSGTGLLFLVYYTVKVICRKLCRKQSVKVKKN